MGNETSSMKIHSLLTADDLKDLRNAFPGGGASPTPVTSLNWGSWKSGLYIDLTKKIIKYKLLFFPSKSARFDSK